MLTSPLRLAPYERRVIELLRNSKDKRARKLAKKRVRLYFSQTQLSPHSTQSFPPLPSPFPSLPHSHQQKQPSLYEQLFLPITTAQRSS